MNTWQELEYHAEHVWDGLQKLHTCTFQLHDQNGKPITKTPFTASNTSELREYFRAGLRAHPHVPAVQVVAIKPAERQDQSSAYHPDSQRFWHEQTQRR